MFACLKIEVEERASWNELFKLKWLNKNTESPSFVIIQENYNFQKMDNSFLKIKNTSQIEINEMEGEELK